MSPFSPKLLTAALCLSTLVLPLPTTASEPVTQIYGDFGGVLWTPPTPPTDDSNNLVAFTTADGTFSTGVNDALLTAAGISFQAMDFAAFPVNNSELIGANLSYVGVPTNWQGQTRGPGTAVDISNLAYYLSDGVHGLDISTVLYNINTRNLTATQAGYETLNYSVSIGSEAAVTDNIPDIIVTQMGNVGTADRFHLTDSNGNQVGTTVSVAFGAVGSLYNQPNTLYSSLTGAYDVTAAAKRVRLLTFKFSDFGLDASNYSDVSGFVHTLSGQSDIAFTAYNRNSVAVNAVDIAVNLATSGLSCPIEAGANGQVTITITNTSDFLASNVPIAIPLPSAVDFSAYTVSFSSGADPASANYDENNGLLSLQSLAANDTATLIIDFTVNDTVAAALNFVASLNTSDFLQSDSEQSNNSSDNDLPVLCPNIEPVPVGPWYLLWLLLTATMVLGLRHLPQSRNPLKRSA